MAEDHGRLGKLPKVKKSGKILHYKDPKTGVVHAVSRGKKKKSVTVKREVRDGVMIYTERVKKKLKKKDPFRTEQRRQTKDYEALKKLRKEQQSEEAAGAPLDTPERRTALTGARKVVARRGKKKTFKEGQAKFRQGRRTK
jgi:hypothetical protein